MLDHSVTPNVPYESYCYFMRALPNYLEKATTMAIERFSGGRIYGVCSQPSAARQPTACN